MSFLVVPALIALLIKLFVLVASRSASRSQARLDTGDSRVAADKLMVFGAFTTMVLVMSGHNLVELLFYSGVGDGNSSELLLRWYYLFTVLSLGSMVVYAKSVSAMHSKNSKLSTLVNGTVVIVSFIAGVSIFFTNSLILGVDSIGYSITAIQGEYFWTFFMLSILAFALIYGYLIIGYISAKTHQSQIQCGYTLVALLPIMLTSIGLIVLMNMGYRLNAALVMPLASAAFLVITLRGEREHQMFDIRRHIPYSLERQTSGQIMDIFSQYTQDKISYKDALTQIERLLVLHKHEKHDGNVSSTAASMEMPRSSLYSIFRRLDIDLDELKQSKD